MFIMVVLSVLNIVIAHLAADTAKRRGRSVKSWMWLGLIFGPIAWLAVPLLPSLQREQTA